MICTDHGCTAPCSICEEIEQIKNDVARAAHKAAYSLGCLEGMKHAATGTPTMDTDEAFEFWWKTEGMML